MVSSGLKPKKSKKDLGHKIGSGVKKVSNFLKWLTEPTSKGGLQYIIYTAALYASVISIENYYVDFGGKKFVPLPGVDNTRTDLSRIIPLGDIGNSIIGSSADVANFLGAKVSKPKPFNKTDLIVWADPRFYPALLLSLLVNGIQAIALRKIRLEVLERKLKTSLANDKKIADIVKSFEELEAESMRIESKKIALQIKNHGNGRFLLLGCVSIASWLYELSMFTKNSPIGASGLTTFGLALVSVFGAELLWSLADEINERVAEEG